MTPTEKPDPLGIREISLKHWDNQRLCERYYVPYETSTPDGTFRQLRIDGHPVTDWHQSFGECYAELADKIRQWELENPELAIKEKA